MSADQSPRPTFRLATANDLAAVEAWLRDERERTGEGFYCNWSAIAGGFEAGEMFVVDVEGNPVAFLVNEDAQHLIAEVRPDRRGHGYGRVIAKAMVAQSTDWGLSVIDFGCSPETSVPFWERMGFIRVSSRTHRTGGAYAYREIPRPLDLGEGERIPFAVRFYEENAHRSGREPFRAYRGDGELRSGRRLALPERAACYTPEVWHLSDCFVEIEVDGQQVYREKTKRPEAAALGMKCDQGGVPYIETVCLPLGPGTQVRGTPSI